MSKTFLVKKDGEISMGTSFDYLCSKLRNGRYVVKIERHSEKRSLDQNALMWLWFTCIEHETGTEKIDIHDYYCSKFLRRVVVVNGEETVVVGSTSKLNTVQMTDFLNKVQADAADEIGIKLPLPEDRFYSEFVDEYKNRY